jgi:hypothetical protein
MDMYQMFVLSRSLETLNTILVCLPFVLLTLAALVLVAEHRSRRIGGAWERHALVEPVSTVPETRASALAPCPVAVAETELTSEDRAELSALYAAYEVGPETTVIIIDEPSTPDVKLSSAYARIAMREVADLWEARRMWNETPGMIVDYWLKAAEQDERELDDDFPPYHTV